MFQSGRIISLYITFFIIAGVYAGGCSIDYYNMEDFNQIKKIDAHIHLNSTDSAFVKQAKTDNFRLLTINTDYSDFPPLNEQEKIAKEFIKKYPDRIAFACSFLMNGWDETDWQEKVISHIDSAVNDGAVAVKVWKNIGMEFRDKNGKLIMIDDPKFDKIFRSIQQRGVTLIGHQGEPKECWMPVDKMRIKDLKEYFTQHPQFHMYLHPEMPSHEVQMKARDSMLKKNKDIIFMGAHLASLEWDTDELASFLRNFPNAVVDLGARMNQLQYQTSVNREKVRKFFNDYQDRLLYATDIPQDSGSDGGFRKSLHRQWINDWKYLTTDSVMTISDFDASFKGLKLTKEVVDKIYYSNFIRTFPKAWR